MSAELQKRYAVGLKVNQAAQEEQYQLSLKAEEHDLDLLLKLAAQYNVPVIRNSSLAEILNFLDLNQEIPKALLPALRIILERMYFSKAKL